MTTSADELFAEMSNWGRWGDDDVLGTLNFLGAEQRIAAASLVTEGRAVGCGRSISPASGSLAEPMIHLMMGTGAEMPEHGAGAAGDWFGMFIHGHTVSHIDSHAHNAWNRRIYNDRDAVEGITASGCAAIGGVEPIGDGVVGRGVLLDLPRARDGSVDARTAFGRADIDECLRRQHTEVREGDIVIVRLGRDLTSAADERVVTSHLTGRERAGLDIECLRWIHGANVAMLCTDGVADVMPARDEDLAMPIHSLGIVAMGLWVVDNLALEELATTCAALDRWEFMFVLSPLRLRRATGSPVNPVAIF